MFQFLGYNFFRDGDALNIAPSGFGDIQNIDLSNAIYDHWYITKNTNEGIPSEYPEIWDVNTLINAGFNGNLNAGNIDYTISQISGVKIKRRISGTFDWLTLKTIPIERAEDLTFVFNDFLNQSFVNYDYALVPIVEGAEGNYNIETIFSKFNGVFITDTQSAYKLLYDVSYNSNSRKQQIGTFEPLGRKYPIVVANGALSYESGTVSATVLNDDFQYNGLVNPSTIVEKKNLIKNFLTNKKPKILKDINGNIWLVVIVSDIGVDYLNGSNMAIPHMTFSWVEAGDPSNQQDLYNAGMLEEVT